MAKEGVTVMVTTHYMDEAELCQRVGFISEGRLIALDSPDQLKQTQMRRQVLEIACEDPALAVTVLRGTGAFEEVALYGALVHAVADEVESLKPQIQRVLHEAGIGLQTMDLIAPSLEDVFISSVRAARRRPEPAE
jgi:ABC-2 type transport system ATP-binding protein